jgi:hypothetical protein
LGLAQQGYGVTVHPQLAFITFQWQGKAPVGGVVAGEMQYRAGIGQFVDRHHL